MSRIYLSPPDVGEAERIAVLAAIDSGWVAPIGPDLAAFEAEVAQWSDRTYAVGLSSGTAALHLALKEVGVQAGDEVIVSTFTFAATANAVVYCGAAPVFIDCERSTWNMSPELLEDELRRRAARGALPAAVVVVDLYGQCASYDRIVPVCAEFNVPLIEDAAEAIGATYQHRPAGSFGDAAVFSFNGNKIITTSGGGMLVTDDQCLAAHARHLATQARDAAPHYEHSEVGYNYRLSNLLAAVGRAQLSTLDLRIAARRAVNERYRAALADLTGIGFLPVADGHQPNFWLTCITIDDALTGATREDVRLALEAQDIESRPTWKPMHAQPVFRHAASRLDGTSDQLFVTGLCLPSGSQLSVADQERVTSIIRGLLAR